MWFPKCFPWSNKNEPLQKVEGEENIHVVSDTKVPAETLSNKIIDTLRKTNKTTPSKYIPPPPVKISSLLITYYDGEKAGWEIKPYIKKEVMLPWKNFLKWYFCRKDSNEYMMYYQNGATLIKRDRIKDFQVKVRNEKEPLV